MDESKTNENFALTEDSKSENKQKLKDLLKKMSLEIETTKSQAAKAEQNARKEAIDRERAEQNARKRPYIGKEQNKMLGKRP
jgi:hypothetical protein